MGKLLNRLNKQLNTEYRQDAEDCLRIYNYLHETTGHVWESEWRLLVSTTFKGWDDRRFKPTHIGRTLLDGLPQIPKTTQ